jgi:hypothetical protein
MIVQFGARPIVISVPIANVAPLALLRLHHDEPADVTAAALARPRDRDRLHRRSARLHRGLRHDDAP